MLIRSAAAAQDDFLAAFRRVQAWLMEKPAALVEEDAPSLAAALDALLEAERSHQLDWELFGKTLCRVERERKNRNLRRGWNLSTERLGSALKSWSPVFGYALCCEVGMHGTELGLNFVPELELVEFHATAEALLGAWRTLDKQQFHMP